MKILGIALGILLILGGIFCVLTPAMTYLTLAWVAGISMVVDAIGSSGFPTLLESVWEYQESYRNLSYILSLQGVASRQDLPRDDLPETIA